MICLLLTKEGRAMMAMMPVSHKQMANFVTAKFVMLVELLLALRVVLRFFNGNPDATFVHWCYTVTQPLLEPFRAVFTTSDVVQRGWVVDYVALFAMAVYAAAAVVVLGWVNAAKEK